MPRVLRRGGLKTKSKFPSSLLFLITRGMADLGRITSKHVSQICSTRLLFAEKNGTSRAFQLASQVWMLSSRGRVGCRLGSHARLCTVGTPKHRTAPRRTKHSDQCRACTYSTMTQLPLGHAIRMWLRSVKNRGLRVGTSWPSQK